MILQSLCMLLLVLYFHICPPCGAASHDLSNLFPLSLCIISIHFFCLSVVIFTLELALSFSITFCSLSSYHIPFWCCFFPLAVLPFFSLLFFSFLTYFPSLFYCFKLLFQFLSRAVVGLQVAQWHWSPVLAHQVMDAGSFPRPPSPHGLGWPTRLPIHPPCTLSPARRPWVPASCATACLSTTPSGTAAPVTFPALSLVSALSPSWARAMTRPWVASMAASGTSWTSSRMLYRWRPVPALDAHLGPNCLHSRTLVLLMGTTSALGGAQAQALVSGQPGIIKRQTRTNGANVA